MENLKNNTKYIGAFVKDPNNPSIHPSSRDVDFKNIELDYSVLYNNEKCAEVLAKKYL